MKFVVIGVVMVVLFGFFHITFIMFDYAYNNPDTGAFTIFTNTMNRTMNAEQRNNSWNQTVMLREFFGIGRFVVLAMCIVPFVLELFVRKRE